MDRNYITEVKKYCEDDVDWSFLNWIKCWLYSFAEYIETEQEEHDSLAKLKKFLIDARDVGVVNKMLIDSTADFIDTSFKNDLPIFCLRHYLTTVGGWVDQNCFTESENSALKNDVCGPKAHNKLHTSANATIEHTNRRFENLERQSYRDMNKTVVENKITSSVRSDLSLHINDFISKQMESQWNAREGLEVKRGEFLLC